jgi:hypothetical protein
MSSKLLTILGIILVGVGLALGLVGIISPTQLAAYMMTLDTAATLVVGGILVSGLANIISMLSTVLANGTHTAPNLQASIPAERVRAVTPESKPEFKVSTPSVTQSQYVPAPASAVDAGLSRSEITSGMAAGAVTTAAAGAISMSERSIPDLSTSAPSASVADAINALEQAKTDMRAAFGGGMSKPQPAFPEVAIPPPHDEPEDDEPVEEAVVETGELYVVEEKLIRNHPARILSDGTVEAETAEGWMRFENVEHLNEYLDG